MLKIQLLKLTKTGGGEDIDRKAIGERLREMRTARGETLEDVASALGVTKQSVSMYENGERMPSDSVKIKYAEHYHRTVQHIFFRQQVHLKWIRN